MSLSDVKFFLSENIRKEAEMYYGLKDDAWLNQVVEHWWDESKNYDERWRIIEGRVTKVGRILDMAAGCGTFLLFGLNRGYDVWGVEPEEWKREFFKRKVLAAGYPVDYCSRLVSSVGETLPFQSEQFDLVTSYQTLEHVHDVKACLQEMIRVVRSKGYLYIKAPDYGGFFEPHYRIPFLPSMNKSLASIYLKLLGKPLLGLQTLNWITEKRVVNFLNLSGCGLKIESTRQQAYQRRFEKIERKLPKFFRKNFVVKLACELYGLRESTRNFSKIGLEENNIDLWITKLK